MFSRCFRLPAHAPPDFTKSVFVGTWNVNAKTPKKEWSEATDTREAKPFLEDWLLRDDNGKPIEPDLYAIGLQEVVALNALNLIGPKHASRRWENIIRDAIGHKYHLIGTEQRVGLLLLVFIHEKQVRYISQVQFSNVAVGFLGVIANKGGVAVRFNLHDSSFCFIATHLWAFEGRDYCLKRNANFHSIINGLKFNSFPKSDKPLHVRDHDFVFWTGDLNYRIDMPRTAVYHNLNPTPPRIEPLLKYDQLNNERAAGTAFDGFSEGNITFKPTYQYLPKSCPAAYDMENKKKTNASLV